MKLFKKQKSIILFLCIVLLMPQGIPTNTIIINASAKTGVVTASSLNVREGPSTDANRLQLNGVYVYLVKGDKIEIIKETGKWYLAKLKFNSKEVQGYVHGDYIKVDKTETKPAPTKPAPTPTPKPTSTKVNYDKIDNELKIPGVVVATNLNVRKGPQTTYSIIEMIKNGTKVTVVNEFTVAKTKWYRIMYKVGKTNKYGYVSGDFIKLDTSKAVKANISAKTIKIRKSAGSSQAYLKNSKGNIVSLKQDKAVSILSEKTVANQKWFEISFTVSSVKYKGYILASDLAFRVTEVKATPKPTPTPDPETKPTPAPETKPEPTPKPTPKPEEIFEVKDLKIHDYFVTLSTGYVCNTKELNVYEYYYSQDGYLYDYSKKPIVLKNKDKITANYSITYNGDTWYFIELLHEGILFNGFVQAKYIYIGDELPTGNDSNNDGGNNPQLTDSEFEKKLIQEGFPDDYIKPLMELHRLKPLWDFKAYHTNLDWKTVIKDQGVPGKNTIPNNKSVEWKSLDPKAYNWKSDVFIPFDGSTWVTASTKAIEYYMDPRNFLEADTVFQFELLRYHCDYQTAQGVENVLKGTALYNSNYTFTNDFLKDEKYTYGETFIKAAEYSGVSPYHLASRVKQEIVTGPSTLSNSVSGKVAGFEGLFNFFNIGANDSTKPGENIANGLRYARNGTTNPITNALYMIPWTNPYKSIVGGSYMIGNNYINRGQDTVYLQKFNVTPKSTHFHQYMTNVEAPWAEGRKIAMAYNTMEDIPIVFSIPVYTNMPKKVSPRPTKEYNPNNRMKSLKVTDDKGKALTLTPTFNQEIYDYAIIVGQDIDLVNITSTAVSKLAKVNGGGSKILNKDYNKIEISVIAENGNEAIYTVNIIKE
ncbi:MAG TPA: SH3 domain-containing protein [Clostridiales bacterium]|nr:SH3 domain-containing protein [Clostridiales bacterium]